MVIKNMTLGAKIFFVSLLCAGAMTLVGTPALAGNVSQKIAFDPGQVHFAPGDEIRITAVKGDREKIEPGGTYSVQGTYNLASRETATLGFFVTAPSSGPTPTNSKQVLHIKKGQGHFELAMTMNSKGEPHVSFYPEPNGESFGGVYFKQRVSTTEAAPAPPESGRGGGW